MLEASKALGGALLGSEWDVGGEESRPFWGDGPSRGQICLYTHAWGRLGLRDGDLVLVRLPVLSDGPGNRTQFPLLP